MGIAEQMGRMLQRTSISVNIKERLDFSCALFSPAGDLVANAPHVPVHLGAMSEAVRFQVYPPHNYICASNRVLQLQYACTACQSLWMPASRRHGHDLHLIYCAGLQRFLSRKHHASPGCCLQPAAASLLLQQYVPVAHRGMVSN